MASENDHKLNDGWRWVLAIVALLALPAGWYVWAHPAKHAQFAPQCPSAAPSGSASTIQNCIGEVEADNSTLVIALLGMSAFLGLIAANGRRLASLKAPGGAETNFEGPADKALKALSDKGSELELTPDEKVLASAKPLAALIAAATPAVAGLKRITIGTKDLDIFPLHDVPTGVVADLLQELAKKGQLPSTLDVEFVAHQTGVPGNYPWFFRFHGQRPTYRLSYGGQGKVEPTLKEL